MEQLEILKGIAHHCTNYDEFSYLWDIARNLLNETNYEGFIIHCLAYFSIHYFLTQKLIS